MLSPKKIFTRQKGHYEMGVKLLDTLAILFKIFLQNELPDLD
jgi:hypothetical protein